MKRLIAKTQYELTAQDLHVLLALTRGTTLAEAARRLGADASTVFRSVQRIEKNLGQRLFERSRRGYLPTEGMLVLAGHAERMEAELEAARSTARGPQADSAGVTGLVRLTTTDAVLRGLVLPCLPPLLSAHPMLQLDCRTGNELASLSRRDADVALRATRKPPDHLVGRKLGTVRFVVCGAAGRDKPVPGRKTSKNSTTTTLAAQLAGQDWIAPDESLPEHPSVLWRRKQLPRVVPRHYADGIVALTEMIKAGLGVGVVPVFMLAAEPALVPLTPVLDDCESDLWLLAHPESRHLRRIAVVYDHFAEHLRLA